MAYTHIEDLETALRMAPGGNDPTVSRALRNVLAELTDRASRSSADSAEFFLAALQALSRIRGRKNLGLRWRCARECCSFFFHHGHARAALESAQHQHLLSESIGSAPTSITALNSLGVVSADVGDTAQAIIHYSKALELARESADIESEALVLNNLGTALNYSGLYSDAIPCFERVVALTQPTWKYRLDLKALSNMAQSWYYLENLPRAFQAIEECLRQSPRPRDVPGHFEQTIREFTFASIALESRQYDLAIQGAERCRRSAQSTNSPRCHVMAEIVLARCDVLAGETTRGLSRIERALEESRIVDSGFRDALVAIVKAYDEAQRPDMALLYLEKLLVHIREHRTRGLAALLCVEEDSTLRTERDELGAFERKRTELRERAAEQRVARGQVEMLERLAVSADLREGHSGEHGYRVGRLAALFARQLGWSQVDVERLEAAAGVHDIGKVAIPDRILSSSEALRDGESRLMMTHTVIGAEILGGASSSDLSMARGIARHHHEWWDGSGYPDSLAGDRIPLHVRMASLADVFDSLTHDQPLAKALRIEEALRAIEALGGRQFDPALSTQFVSIVRKAQADFGSLDGLFSRSCSGSPFLAARRRIRDLLNEELHGPAVAQQVSWV